MNVISAKRLILSALVCLCCAISAGCAPSGNDLDMVDSSVSETEITTISTTTPATTKAPVQTSATETPTDEDTVIETEIEPVTKYVTEDCYGRIEGRVGTQPIDSFSAGDSVTVVAKTNTDYYKVSSGCYIHADYLSDTPPEKQE